MDGMLCDRCGDVATHFHEDFGNCCDACAEHWTRQSQTEPSPDASRDEADASEEVEYY